MATLHNMHLFHLLKRNGKTADGSTSFINEWDAVRYLGRGNFGVVYEIEKINKSLGEQHSALKIIELDEKSIEKYKDEIAALNSIRNHPHGVSIEDFSELHLDEGDFVRRYVLIRMELLKPMPADGMSEEEVIQMALDVSDVLSDCHSQQRKILHCDIKPVNILMTENGRYKLSDFGEARFLEKSHGSSGMRGTPLYMSPEMISFKGYDERSDLYSLGVTMYAMLNGGCVPFYSREMGESGERNAIYSRFAGEKFPKIKGVRPELLRIIRKLCEVDPNKRYQRASQLNRDLKALVRKKEDEQRRKEEAEIARHLREKQKEEAAKKRLEDKRRREDERRKLEAEKNATKAALAEKQNEAVLLGTTVMESQREQAQQSDLRENTDLRISEANHKRAPVFGGKRFAVAVILLLVVLSVAVVIKTVVDNNYNTTTPSSSYTSSDDQEKILNLSGIERPDLSDLHSYSQIDTVNLTGCGFSDIEILELKEKYPHITFIWDVMLYEKTFPSNSRKLLLNDISITDLSELESKIDYFDSLKSIDMTNCGLDNKTLDVFRKDLDGIDVIWTVGICGVNIPTNTSNLGISFVPDNNYQEIRYDGITKQITECKDLSNISYLTKISSFDITVTDGVEEFDVAWMLSSKEMKRLLFDVWSGKIYNHDLLGELEQLRYLSYGNTIDTDYSFIKNLVNLTELDIRNRSNTTDFSFLSKTKNINNLSVEIKNTDEYKNFIDYASNLSALKFLQLRIIANEDKLIVDFAQLNKLTAKSLFLFFEYGSPEGIETLNQLHSIKNMEILAPSRLINEDFVEELKKALPDCRISYYETNW